MQHATLEEDPAGELRLLVADEVSCRLLERKGFPTELRAWLTKLGREGNISLGYRSGPAPRLEPDPPLVITPRGPTEKPEVVVGTAISGRPIPLAKVVAGSVAVVRGRIFRLEVRTLRNGAEAVRLGITDDETSLYLKMYRSPGSSWSTERLAEGQGLWARGRAEADGEGGEVFLRGKDLAVFPWPERTDPAPEKRVELHLHTKMSAMDSVLRLEETFQLLSRWGHSAVAITDHGVVQAFPEAYELGKRYGLKVIFGLEAYLVDDQPPLVREPRRTPWAEEEWVVLDLETSGLSPWGAEILEIGAVRLRGDEVLGEFQAILKPAGPVPPEILTLTGLTAAELAGGEEPGEVLGRFREFLGAAGVIAHNADFDAGFLRHHFRLLGLPPLKQPILDTLAVGRVLLPELKRHRLEDLGKALRVPLQEHHRALSDARTAAGIWRNLLGRLRERGIGNSQELNDLGPEMARAHLRSHHAVILVKDQPGLERLYRLVSESHLHGFHRHPRIPRSVLRERDGLLIGSACQAGELYRAILSGQEPEVWEEIAGFYDYLEIQPVENNRFLLKENPGLTVAGLQDLNRLILDLGRRLGKPVVAAGDVHFLHPDDQIYRQALLKAQGYRSTEEGGLYLRSTAEMLDEFSYLGTETARQVVIDAPVALADSIDALQPIPDGLFTPEMPEAEPALREMVWQRAAEMYGETLPAPVAERIEREMSSIVQNGFSVVYYIAHRLVKKSLDDGYLVGSRGSVGSSLVATLAGITEVNPLPPHYLCPSCHHSDFAVGLEYGSGFDLPGRACPVCGENLGKDGQDIPFETFLGFEGDKVPDIDLNFSGQYQATVHRYTEELFGRSSVFRAGTIATIAERTAFGLVKSAFADRALSGAEVDRLALGLTGVKRTTGQHPGGLMILPAHLDIHRFTPIQRPADDQEADVVTTHFDYHAISHRLLKLDILGHDDPTVLRLLEDLTGWSVHSVPLDEPATLSLFSGVEELGVSPEAIGSEVGTIGLPEFGTRFVRGMLTETRPRTFSELIRISGLSHGTDVWTNNAQELIRDKRANLAEVIATRDDIMVYLMREGLPPREAFRIMERVRKGQGLTEADRELMRTSGVPDWYVGSCDRIRYMFPKAHAAAYVTMAVRIAYYKVHFPAAFYASFFTVRGNDFDVEIALAGLGALEERLKELEGLPAPTVKERNLVGLLEVVREMYLRGINFLTVDLYESDPVRFRLTPKGLLPPLISIPGLGLTGVQRLAAAREEASFLSIDDVRRRARLPQPILAVLERLGAFKSLPAHDQLQLF